MAMGVSRKSWIGYRAAHRFPFQHAPTGFRAPTSASRPPRKMIRRAARFGAKLALRATSQNHRRFVVYLSVGVASRPVAVLPGTPSRLLPLNWSAAGGRWEVPAEPKVPRRRQRVVAPG